MKIKRTQADFRVQEILTAEAEGRISARPGPAAVYRLTKEGLTTPEAVARVARALGAPEKALAYAGLKDKHAHTVQHISVALPEGKGPAELEGRNWRLERAGWMDGPLDSSAIAANRFAIVVSGLSPEESDFMERAAGLLAPPSAPGEVRIVNYFGDQRFGSARHGQGFLARHLIDGEFETALKLAIATVARKDQRRLKDFKRRLADGWGKWKDILPTLPRCPERRAVETLAATGGDFRAAFAALPYLLQWLAVEAYQSFLWNRIAAALVVERCGGERPVTTTKGPFGTLVFPPARAVPGELAGLDLPLLGRNSRLLPPWKSAGEDVLAEEGITTANLRIPGLRRPYFGQAPRPLFVSAAGFSLSPPEPEGPPAKKGRLRRRLSFDLPRGAYATVLLRALGQ